MAVDMKKVRVFAVDFLFLTVGSSIYAFCVNAFTAPNNIAPGGVTGIATMINYLSGIPIGSLIFFINLPIILLAFIKIGYKLVIKSAIAIVLSSVMIDLFSLFVTPYKGDMVLVALFAGILEGVGLSLTFIRGATTGGSDMIARLFIKSGLHLSMGKIMLMIDAVVIATSGFVFKSVESAMYACVLVFVASRIIDTILNGTDIGRGKLFYIFSRKNKDISDGILTDLQRGASILKAKSAYSGEDLEVLMCAVRNYEIGKMREIIDKSDKDAFVVMGDANEIMGEGFKSNKTDDKTLKELLGRVKKDE